jgi:hypothetical protein
MRLFILSTSLLLLYSCKNNTAKTNENYSAGFKIIKTKDTSRIYKPETDTSDYLHFRPLDIDVWYPASVTTKDTALFFSNILGLLETRANYYTASNSGNGITMQIAQFFCDNLKCSNTTQVLSSKTNSFSNAVPSKGKFPLVIYMASYNGMSYENFTLFEELAKKGFVVLAVSSIGRFPGDMTMKNEDMLEQVMDAIASVNKLSEQPMIDFTRIGVVGYSWGGLSGSLLTSMIPNIACLISLDGSEFHRYGNSKEENTDFNATRYSTAFKNLQIAMPYLRLESTVNNSGEKPDSVYNFTEKLFADKQIFILDSSSHEDFSCLPHLVKKSGGCAQSNTYNTITKLTIGFLEKHLKNNNSFDEITKTELDKTIRKK